MTRATRCRLQTLGSEQMTDCDESGKSGANVLGQARNTLTDIRSQQVPFTAASALNCTGFSQKTLQDRRIVGPSF